MEAENIGHTKRGFASFVLQIGLPALALLLAALGSPVSEVYATQIRVTVDFPTDGSSFAKPVPQAIIAGRARVRGTQASLLDLALVIDRSGSTAGPSGADLDGDGTEGELMESKNTDPGDSVLAAELAGARNLLKLLDPANTRVNVISFGRDLFFWGRGPLHRRRGQPHWEYSDLRMPNARVEQPLTLNYWKVREALARIRDIGPQGGTNMAAAIREATAELIGARADSPARPGAKKVMLLLTDGFPSSPAGSPDVTDPEDTILALRAAYLARKAGIEIHTYALSPQAVSFPFALTEIARITGGRFHPISDPSQVVYRLKEVIFVRLESLVVENATLGQPAKHVALGPEGAYIAVIPVRAGMNKIEVTGIACDGTRGGASVLLNYLPEGEQDPALQRTEREVILSPGTKSYDDLKLGLEKEKKRRLELNRKTKELELRAREKGKGREQLELDLEVK